MRTKSKFTNAIIILLSIMFLVCMFNINQNANALSKTIDQEIEILSEKVDLTELEDSQALLLKKINDLRATKKLAPLKLDADLNKIAVLRASAVSIDTKRTGHDLTKYGSPTDTLDMYGYKGAGYTAENLYYAKNTKTDLENINGAMASWTKSSGHYKNMIGKDYKKIGIGFVKTENNTFSKYNKFAILVFTDK